MTSIKVELEREWDSVDYRFQEQLLGLEGVFKEMIHWKKLVLDRLKELDEMVDARQATDYEAEDNKGETDES